MTELTATAGLFDELAFLLDFLRMRFAVSHLRRADMASTLNSRFMRSTMISRVQFTHAGDDGLTGFFVGARGKTDLLQPDGPAIPIFSWSGLGFGSTAKFRITGSRNSMRSDHDRRSGSHRVSPVVTSSRPTPAISPRELP